jgi:hypothetical protein
MIDVVRQSGIFDIQIHGFMANNASGGWNAVSKVFMGEIRDPNRERSDACHWAQSIHQHTILYIKESRRSHHFELWNKLQDAKNIVQAYQIFQEISAWWKEGHAHPDKLKMLEGWMALWVVRWTQWGNYIRLVCRLPDFASCLIVRLFFRSVLHLNY